MFLSLGTGPGHCQRRTERAGDMAYPLQPEVEQVVQEVKQVVQEVEQVVQEVKQVVQEVKQVVQEVEHVVQEVKQVVQEVEQVVQEVKQVVQEVKQVVQEVKQVVQEVEHVVQEVKQVVQEVEQVVQEVEQVVQEAGRATSCCGETFKGFAFPSVLPQETSGLCPWVLVQPPQLQHLLLLESVEDALGSSLTSLQSAFSDGLHPRLSVTDPDIGSGPEHRFRTRWNFTKRNESRLDEL
uniref:Methyl-accepting transducer domain-containing protein n=1 Tax=Knipowitschia caucasica TaxID=637954 RepID=A0AAV2M918_KNICA